MTDKIEEWERQKRIMEESATSERVGHPEALRMWIEGSCPETSGWGYVDQANRDLYFTVLVFTGWRENLVEIDLFIERLEAEEAPAGEELRDRRRDALRLFRAEMVGKTHSLSKFTDFAFAGHIEWIMLRKEQIETAGKISKPARDKKKALSETNSNNSKGKQRGATITKEALQTLCDQYEAANGKKHGWKKIAARALHISAKTVGNLARKFKME